MAFFSKEIFWYFPYFFVASNIDCVYSLEQSRGGSNEYSQSKFLSENKKKMCLRKSYISLY